jgi:hypothetical protein
LVDGIRIYPKNKGTALYECSKISSKVVLTYRINNVDQILECTPSKISMMLSRREHRGYLAKEKFQGSLT